MLFLSWHDTAQFKSTPDHEGGLNRTCILPKEVLTLLLPPVIALGGFTHPLLLAAAVCANMTDCQLLQLPHTPDTAGPSPSCFLVSAHSSVDTGLEGWVRRGDGVRQTFIC